MEDLDKSKKAPFLKVVKKQQSKMTEGEQPPPLGEPAGETKWLEHHDLGHEIVSYSKVVEVGPDQKQILMHRHEPGMKFITTKENCPVGYWIWIWCVEIKTGRVISKENSGNVHFVDWYIPVK